MSVTSSIPPPATHETFNTIFTSQRERQAIENPWEHGNSAERRPEDVIYTLHQTIENLENGARGAEDDGVRWEVIHESPSNADGVKHLDGLPKIKSLDELVAQFRPFKAPPPPQPFPDAPDQAKASDKKAAAKASTRGRPRQKTFTTTITVTESTDADGQKSYTASSSPIIRMPDPQPQTLSLPSASTRQPFLTRMYRRRLAQSRIGPSSFPQTPAGGLAVTRREPSGARQERIQRMYLISVKRQRKLKMKKHKYKKLMKRTRNLRRKLDRN
jgi:type IV secretory pathway VirB10-like protein